jgi:hypothetical protein
MTERERWVVYPLLFLALGAALRDKLVDRTITKSIVCQELTVVDEEPLGHQPTRILARIFRTDPKPGSTAGATLMVNGHVEIIGDDPAGVQPARSLIRIGRNYPSANGPVGYVDISGNAVIDGVINAKQYAVQNIPLIPGLQILPGRKIPKTPNAPPPGKPSPPQPPAKEPKASTNAPPPSPAED